MEKKIAVISLMIFALVLIVVNGECLTGNKPEAMTKLVGFINENLSPKQIDEI